MVEGDKIIKELLLSDYKVKEVFSISPESLVFSDGSVTKITEQELHKISFLQHPKNAVAVCELASQTLEKEHHRQLVLDGIQDPGNLGTIIRLADWFGIEQIVCSEDTVDVYNPKVIQASMGSFLRVKVVYVPLAKYLKQTENKNLGTDMEGENLFRYDFPEKFNLILGNEGNGIRPEIEQILLDKISIPRFGKQKTTESLNVSMATAICLGQIFSGR